MKKISVLMYTKGMGSGHLTRVNAVYKGFCRENIDINFYLLAPRSKYLDRLEAGIEKINIDKLPEHIDIFICDWKEDEFTNSLSIDFAKVYFGLRRFGTIKSTFPDYYYIFGIEPGVRGDELIWPVICTWRDELLTKEELIQIYNLPTNKKIALFAENGAYEKHIDKVFEGKDLPEYHKLFSSNSPYCDKVNNISFYPVARLFGAVDYLILGAGYNSTHEALCFANCDIAFINVGGDDQAIRIRKKDSWEKKNDSNAHILAKRMFEIFLERGKHGAK